MKKKVTGAASISTSSVRVVAHGVTSGVDGRRLCIECAEWKSLETFDEHSKVCQACSEARG